MSVSSPPLLDDIVIEILKKAPLKSLHRLKWLSKSWFSLINNEVLPQLIRSPNPCIYYINRLYSNNDLLLPKSFLSLAGPNNNRMLEKEISKSLEFLPANQDMQSPNITILDSCNGLIFCRTHGTLPKNYRYFVCNPVDKTYNEIPPVGSHPMFYALDFNPLTSPHYRLVVIKPGLTMEFYVYQSEKHCFRKAVVYAQDLVHIHCKRNTIALWDGYVYLDYVFATDPRKGWESKVMKISGVLPGAGVSISYKFVKFPEGSYSRDRELRSCMGKSMGKLRFVSISTKRITVWSLRDNQEDEWMLEHDCAATFLGLCEQILPNEDELYIVGFHPVRNVLLIMFKHRLYAYDFDQMSFEKFCEFERDRVFWWSVFSFSPCFAKQVLA